MCAAAYSWIMTADLRRWQLTKYQFKQIKLFTNRRLKTEDTNSSDGPNLAIKLINPLCQVASNVFCTISNHVSAKSRWCYSDIWTQFLHSIILGHILQMSLCMQTKPFLKIWLQSVDFEKFTSLNLSRDQSQTSNARLWFVSLSVHRCGFLKVSAQHQFSRMAVCIHYHFCKPSSQIVECKTFAPYDFLEINSYHNILSMVSVNITTLASINRDSSFLTKATQFQQIESHNSGISFII